MTTLSTTMSNDYIIGINGKRHKKVTHAIVGFESATVIPKVNELAVTSIKASLSVSMLCHYYYTPPGDIRQNKPNTNKQKTIKDPIADQAETVNLETLSTIVKCTVQAAVAGVGPADHSEQVH